VDTVQAIATVFAAVAAAVAIIYAHRTVRESERMRREERLHRLISLVSELAFAMRRGAEDSRTHLLDLVPLLQLQLAGALGAFTSPFPHTTLLTLTTKAEINPASIDLTESDEISSPETELSLEDIDRMAANAIEEISAQLPSE
jgi:hypothetical protein